MIGKATIDLNRRNISSICLLWNRLTPTRGAKKVARNLALLAARGKVLIQVEKDGLFIKEGEKNLLIAASESYAKCLVRTGVQNLELKKGIPAKKTKQVLNALSNRGLGGIIRKLSRLAIKIEEPERASPDLPISWVDLYKSMCKFSWDFDEIASSIKTLIEDLYHFFYFKKNYQRLRKLAYGIRYINPKKAVKLINRSGYKGEIINEYMNFWDSENLLWALEQELINDPRKLESIPRIASLLESIQATSDPNILREFSKNPLWIIRKEVALNPHTPEDVLGYLVNFDPHLDVRKAVAENPFIKRLLALAEKSNSAQELARLAQKPFPCLRAAVAANPNISIELLENLAKDRTWIVAQAVAENPKTPWESVALALAKRRKDVLIQDKSMPNIMITSCGGAEYLGDIYYTITEHGYFRESINDAERILEIHQTDRSKILERLKKLNPKFYKVLARK